MLSKTIGPNGMNIKKLGAMIKRKIKVIPTTEDMGEFIKSLVYPVKFKNIAVQNDEVIIYAATQSKAMLIGRGSSRLEEMKEILKNHFNVKKLRVL
jgi:NusA-like KH domain protein